MASAMENVLARDVLLSLRGLAVDILPGKPCEHGLCEAQVDGSAIDFSTDLEEASRGTSSKKGNGKGKSGKARKAEGGAATEHPWRRDGLFSRAHASTEGGSGGTSGGDYPWRRGREDGEGGSGGAPGSDYPWRRERVESPPEGGAAANSTEYPWRRSPPYSPELGSKPPWRKTSESPEGTPELRPEALPSPAISDIAPEGIEDEPTFELKVEERTDRNGVLGTGAIGGTGMFDALAAADPATHMAMTHTDQFEQEEASENEFESDDDEGANEEEIEEYQQEGPQDHPKKNGWSSSNWKQNRWNSSSQDNGWISVGSHDKGIPLPCDVVVSPSPPPPLPALAGTWFDSLGNMIQVPLYPAVAWFSGVAGSTEREFSLDKWGRLWCGNGVLHQVGFYAGPLAGDMPPSHLSWRTTGWKFSVWERVSAPAYPMPPPQGEHGAASLEIHEAKGHGNKAGGKGRHNAGRSKGAGGERRKPPPAPSPTLPKLSDFASFPALGKSDPKAKAQPRAEA